MLSSTELVFTVQESLIVLLNIETRRYGSIANKTQETNDEKVTPYNLQQCRCHIHVIVDPIAILFRNKRITTNVQMIDKSSYLNLILKLL